MIFAAAHIPLVYSIAPAALLAVVVAWYWLHLSRGDVPASRRRIRRVSLAIIIITIPLLVTGLSVIDPARQATAYVVIWSTCALLLLLIITTAIIDAMNNIRLHREMRHDQLIRTAATLYGAAQALDGEPSSQHEDPPSPDSDLKAGSP